MKALRKHRNTAFNTEYKIVNIICYMLEYLYKAKFIEHFLLGLNERTLT